MHAGTCTRKTPLHAARKSYSTNELNHEIGLGKLLTIRRFHLSSLFLGPDSGAEMTFYSREMNLNLIWKTAPHIPVFLEGCRPSQSGA
jgi:hypothetical protein